MHHPVFLQPDMSALRLLFSAAHALNYPVPCSHGVAETAFVFWLLGTGIGAGIGLSGGHG